MLGGWRPGRTSGAARTAPRPAPTTSPRAPRWRSSPAAATRSTPWWRAGSSSRWWSRTCAGRAARCPPCSSRPATRRRGCCAVRGSRRARATTALLRDELGSRPRSPAPACSRPRCPARGTAGSPCCATTAPCRSPRSSARPSATRPTASPWSPPVPTTIAAVEQHFREHWPSSAATWLPDGRVPTATHRLPALAATWRRLLAEAVGPTREAQIDAARAAWYRGFVAEEIERFVATPVRDATGRDHAGLLTADDLAGWSCSYEDALVVGASAGGGRWPSPGAWSQGPVLAQTLQLLRDADLGLRRRRADRGHRAPGHRGRQARVRRPGGLVRRQRARPARRAGLARVRRRAPGPDRRHGVAGAAARRTRRGRPRAWPPRPPRAASAATASTPAGLGEPTAARSAGRRASRPRRNCRAGASATAARTPGVGEPTAAAGTRRPRTRRGIGRYSDLGPGIGHAAAGRAPRALTPGAARGSRAWWVGHQVA